uniref:Uncharacterized protein n=1 Tax=Picea sitchensis TaxID=3332 RepID=A9NR84_PICSI|nr:unknown [Picea sitchensis]
MGWWSKKENSEQSQAQEDRDSDEIHKDVLAAGRDACYKARDTFFACVEKGKSKPTEVASVGLLYPAECKAARSEFVKQCRPTWVSKVLNFLNLLLLFQFFEIFYLSGQKSRLKHNSFLCKHPHSH